MVFITEHNGRYIIEYYTEEQWAKLTGVPKTDEERSAHKALVEERFKAYTQATRAISLAEKLKKEGT